MDIVVVRLNKELEAFQKRMVKIMTPLVTALADAKVIFTRRVESLSRGALFKNYTDLQSNPPHDISRENMHNIVGQLALLMKLVDAVNALKVHGGQSFHKKLLQLEVCQPLCVMSFVACLNRECRCVQTGGRSRALNTLIKTPAFTSLMNALASAGASKSACVCGGWWRCCRVTRTSR